MDDVLPDALEPALAMLEHAETFPFPLSLSWQEERPMRGVPWAVAAVIAFAACTTNVRPTGTPASPGTRAYYDIGAVTTRDVYVSPTSRCQQCNVAATTAETCSGLTLATACQLDEAVGAITSFDTTGYRVRLAGTIYTGGDLNVADKRATRQHPLIFQPEVIGSSYPVIARSVEVNSSSYVYFLGDYKRPADRTSGSPYALTLGPAESPLHISCSDHILVRRIEVTGEIPTEILADETVKVNQSSDVYIEQASIHGAKAGNGNAVDFFAVRRGHVLDSDLARTRDWCIYAKAGSHDISIEGNTIHDCGFDFTLSPPGFTTVGGVSAGEGSDFQLAEAPFLRYQVSAMRVLNNVIYRTSGAGLNVQGAYNAIFAFNTLYDVGLARLSGDESVNGVSLIGVGYGLVNCNPGQQDCAGTPIDERCDEYAEAGGWGRTMAQGADGSEARIPNRHVLISANVIYNRTFAPRDACMTIAGRYSGTENIGTHAPQPPRGDDHLRITDNLIWSATSEEMPEMVPIFESPMTAPGADPSFARNHINEILRGGVMVRMHPRLTTAVPANDRCPNEIAGGDAINCVFVSTTLPDMIWDDTTLPPPDSGLATRVDRNIFFAPHPSRPGAY